MTRGAEAKRHLRPHRRFWPWWSRKPERQASGRWRAGL